MRYLTDKDYYLLKCLADYRCLTSSHVGQLLGISYRGGMYRIQRLRPDYVEGIGTDRLTELVWRLTPKGRGLVMQHFAYPKVNTVRKNAQLNHTLAIVDVLVTCKDYLGGFVIEPKLTGCRPDALVGVGRGKLLKPFFLEVDRGTQSINVVKKKCAQYESWARTKERERKFGNVVPQVLYITNRDDKVRESIKGGYVVWHVLRKEDLHQWLKQYV